MIEKLKTMDFDQMSEDETKNVLIEMLELNDDDLKECVNVIVDSINYEDTDVDNIDELSVSYRIIFDNDKIKQIMEELLEEYDKEI
jgi:hypothetical protein